MELLELRNQDARFVESSANSGRWPRSMRLMHLAASFAESNRRAAGFSSRQSRLVSLIDARAAGRQSEYW